MIQSKIAYLIGRLEEALETQDNTEGEIASTPTVGYCFQCDEIGVDTPWPDGCINHPTVTSDGYEHDGIGTAITTLCFLQESTNVESLDPEDVLEELQ